MEIENSNKEAKKLNIDKDKLKKLVVLFKAINTMNIIKNDNAPIEIINNIYIGSVGAANNKEKLLEIGITHIINATSTLKNCFANQFVYLKLENLLDSPECNIKKHFKDTNNFIESALKNTVKFDLNHNNTNISDKNNSTIENSNKVLIHCHAGISRSSTIILAYMIGVLKYKYEDALKICKEKRSKINPNEGFIKQLKEYELEVNKLYK